MILDDDPGDSSLDLSIQDSIIRNTFINCPNEEYAELSFNFSTNLLNLNMSSIFWVCLMVMVYQGGIFRESDSFYVSKIINVNKYSVNLTHLTPNFLEISYFEKLSGDEKCRLRCGVYRVLYEIEDEQLVICIVRVRNRKDVYR